MSQGFDGPATGFAREPGEDTIEIELTDEQALDLSHAANEAQAHAANEPQSITRPPLAQSSPRSFSPSCQSFVYRRSARIDLVCTLTFAVALGGITAASVWHGSNRHAPVPVVVSATPHVPAPAPPAAPAEPAEPQGSPVLVTNPFDATEVFEFPPATTEIEARQSVAELLLQRGRDRRSQAAAINHQGSRHLARSAADEPPEVFVTRLSGPVSRL